MTMSVDEDALRHLFELCQILVRITLPAKELLHAESLFFIFDSNWVSNDTVHELPFCQKFLKMLLKGA